MPIPTESYSGSMAQADKGDMLRRIRESGKLLLLTGAGVSSESGIPTFRGEEGYWTVGSEVYQPEEMATQRMFARKPAEVWNWYLYRRTICRQADPNAAHLAIGDLGQDLGMRMRLMTQNVDGLHLRAGSPREQTYEIHGNIDFMRCGASCSTSLVSIPDGMTVFEEARLGCSNCDALMRPHVLWFDECYDEELFRFESSMDFASKCDVVISAGTSGATNLPNLAVHAALRNGAYLMDVNPAPNPFSEIATECGGQWIRATACEALPDLLANLT